MRQRQTCIYKCFTSEGECVYVGASVNPVGRARQHGKDSPWFQLVTRIEVEWLSDGEDTAARELEEIRRMTPKNNLAGVTAAYRRYRNPISLPEVVARSDDGKRLSVEEAARELKVSQRSVRRWLSDGTLPYVKVVGRVRIQRGDLDALKQRVDGKGGTR